MKNTKKVLSLRAIAAAATFCAVGSVQAAGPLAVCNSGQPFLWGNSGQGIVYNLDQGDLGPVAAADAAALIGDAFGAWENIPSSSLSYVEGAQLPVDVDITNFGPFLSPVAPDGLSSIVYDDTGEIFAALFGPGSGILGFAGPEWINGASCEILEGVSFLNGPSFTDLTAALDVSVHEFGHFSNFAHTVVNGQLFIGVGDTSGPSPVNTFPVPFPPTIGNSAAFISTMYPFYFGPNVGTRTPGADDISSASTLYPDANFSGTTGTISGSILFGSSRKSGVNVIARNVADPFFDAVSAISGDYSDSTSQSDSVVGTYEITGLTPGANYVVYVDEMLAGGFSTTPSSPLPGPEEYYNGANESGDSATDDPQDSVEIMVAAGAPVTGIDVQFNLPAPGTALPTGDDGSVEIPLPFAYCVAGQSYDSVYINGNGFLTLGGADAGLTFLPDEASFLSGPARIAALWADFSPNVAGTVSYAQTASTFTATWANVPEFGIGGDNTFAITLTDNSNDCAVQNMSKGKKSKKSKKSKKGSSDVKVVYGAMTAASGIAGYSSGGFAASGFETSSDLSDVSNDGKKKIKLKDDAAVFESFLAGDLDLSGGMVQYDNGGNAYKDRLEKNDSLDKAKKITLAFDSIDTKKRYTSIAPAAADIDFLRFDASAGNTLVADIVTGQIDSVLGLWYCGASEPSGNPSKCDPATALFFGFNDDKGFGQNPLLSGFSLVLPFDGTYAVATTFCCDYDFDGVDAGQGGAFDGGRYVIDIYEIPPL
jgi:hypothetical protein